MKGIKRLCTIFLSCSMIVTITGCTKMTTHSKVEIPKVTYKQAGYAVDGKIAEDGTVKITYALVGVNNKKITYLYLDQIEQKPSEDRHLFTNSELGSAYGLQYKGDHGEWSDQVNAFTNYIVGKKMTLDEVNEIPMEEIEGKEIPKKGSDLEAGCELDLTDFLNVINKAYNNLESTEATRLAVGDDIRVNNEEGNLNVTLAFVGTDYRYKICYSHLETYSITPSVDKEVLSLKQRAENDSSYNNTEESERGFENYIYGLNMIEAYSVETYDSGDGINTALPKVNTDLARVCNIDLDKYIQVLKEASGRL